MKRWMAALPLLAAVLLGGCGSGGNSIGSVDRSGSAPLRILTTSNAAVAVASVRINGQGPLPFIVDTGASQSVLDASVARRLGLSTAGATRQVSGVACQTKASTATISHWTVGGFPLASDRVDVLKLAAGNQRSGGPRIAGLLGSDELSKFGAAAIDYQSGTLRLGTAATRLSTAGATTVRIRVVHQQGAVLAAAPVEIRGRGPYPFVVDSGATTSVIGATVAHQLGLSAGSAHGRATGVACQTKTSVLQISHWRIGSTRLPVQQIAEIKLPRALRSAGVRGLLGSGTLDRFGTVAIDYSAQRLLLAPRLTTPSGGVVPLSVTHTHSDTIAVVKVRIDGHGPYRFALDTGASKSAVDASVARGLNLPSTHHTTTIAGAVAGQTVNLDRVSNWSAGGVSLPADSVAAVSLPHATGPDAVQGLLGSDVLRQFAVVTIDYSHAQLRLGHAASPPASGPKVALQEVNSDGATEVLVPVRIDGRGPFGFTLDTGAGHTLIAQGLAQRLGLPATGGRAIVRGVVAGSTAPLVSVRRWSVGSVALPPVSALALREHAALTPGLLGSDVLSHFGSVTLDYQKDQLLLP